MKAWRQKILALAMAAALLCSCVVGVGAEEEYYNRISVTSLEPKAGYTVQLLNSAGAEVAKTTDLVDEVETEVYKNVVKLNLTITAPKDGQEYVVLLLSGGEEIPTSTNIRYIDQDDVATFTIYPDQMSQPGEYNVIVSSVDGKVTAATFEVLEPPYKLGDVNGDKTPGNVLDAMLLLQYVAGLVSEDDFTKTQVLASDVTKDGAVDVLDAMLLLQFAAGLVDSLE